MGALVAPVVVAAFGAVGQPTSQADPGQARIQRLTVTLKPEYVVPRPRWAGNTSGTFSATYVPYRADARLRFNLTYSRLTGLVTSAHVHIGRRGEFGPVLIDLCGTGGGHCGFAYSWTGAFSHELHALARGRGAYVDVHTRRNPRGELRGQITPAMLGARGRDARA